MKAQARGTMPREAKGPVIAPPLLDGDLQTIVDAVAGWPGVNTTVHWHLFDRSRVDGVDFYLGEDELGHLHLDGSIHLATTAGLAKTLIAEGVARPFIYLQGWVEEDARRIGTQASIALFRRNYGRLQAQPRE